MNFNLRTHESVCLTIKNSLKIISGTSLEYVTNDPKLSRIVSGLSSFF